MVCTKEEDLIGLGIVMLGKWSVESGLLAYNYMSDRVKFLLDLCCH